MVGRESKMALKLIKIRWVILFFVLCWYTPMMGQTVSTQIMVDQVGYRPKAIKIAVFANPQTGQNSYRTGYHPGSYFLVKRTSDDSTVFSNSVVIWNSGNTHADSGDKAWRGNFTAYEVPGRYYIQDGNGRRSFPFSIKEDVYNDLLKQATRMFYYQRCTNVTATHGGADWNHATCHVSDQTAQARSNGTVLSSTWPRKDVHGGWHDAGDHNKYVPFTVTTLWDLMMAYEQNPAAFSDNTGIPESGNGVPDILDEIKFELDWLLRMQMTNRTGNTTHLWGVCNRVASSGGGLPASDMATRYYTYPTTWATASFAAVLAHASRVYAGFNAVFGSYDQKLRIAATNAWKFLEARTNMYPSSGDDFNCGLGAACGSSSSSNDRAVRMLAAAELFATTGSGKYKIYYEAHFQNPVMATFMPAPGILPMAHVVYASAAGADPARTTLIRNSFSSAINTWWIPSTNQNPYRAYVFDYFWGSAGHVAAWSKWLMIAKKLNLNSSLTNRYKSLAEDYIHFIHGLNPLNLVFVTKATNTSFAIKYIYHSWFGTPGTHNPPPGFLTGGPNSYYAADTTSVGGTPRYPPAGQPKMKSYWDWDATWPDASWSVTEPAIYYQASYIYALSAWAAPASSNPASIKSATVSPQTMTNASPLPLVFSIICRNTTVTYTNITIDLSELGGSAGVKMSNVSFNTMWTKTTIPPSNIVAGIKTVTYIAKDDAGGSSSGFIQVQIVDPLSSIWIRSIGIVPQTVTNNANVPIRIEMEAGDAGGSLSSVSIDLSGIGGSASALMMTNLGGTNWYYDYIVPAGLQPGTNTVYLRCLDRYGKTKNASVDLVVLLPQIEILPSYSFEISPNPWFKQGSQQFTPSIKIKYNVPSPSKVNFDIYTITGEFVASIDGNQDQEVFWDGLNNKGRGVAVGIYLVLMLVDGKPVSKPGKLGVLQ